MSLTNPPELGRWSSSPAPSPAKIAPPSRSSIASAGTSRDNPAGSSRSSRRSRWLCASRRWIAPEAGSPRCRRAGTSCARTCWSSSIRSRAAAPPAKTKEQDLIHPRRPERHRPDLELQLGVVDPTFSPYRRISDLTFHHENVAARHNLSRHARRCHALCAPHRISESRAFLSPAQFQVTAKIQPNHCKTKITPALYTSIPKSCSHSRNPAFHACQRT